MEDPAWDSNRVPWSIAISPEGKFRDIMPNFVSESIGNVQKTVAMETDFPRSPVNRNSGEHPLLGSDGIEYVLGAGAWTVASGKDKANRHHKAFVELIRKAADQTRDEALEACSRFYADAAEVEKARAAMAEKGATSSQNVSLYRGGQLVDREAVKAYWRRHYDAAFKKNLMKFGVSCECMISGQNVLIVPTHEPVKGLGNLGGQSKGVALMSFDKDSFESYGWDKNQNSPVSPERALAYVLALNDLLRQDKKSKPTRRDFAGIGFIFWLRNPDDRYSTDMFFPPSTKDIQALFNLEKVNPNPNHFYMAGVSGNGGRLRVRYWATDTLPRLLESFTTWHEDIKVDYPWNDSARPIWPSDVINAIYQRRTSKVKERKKREAPSHLVLSVLKRMIEGRSCPLGYGVLTAALLQLRHPARPEPKTGKKQSSTQKGPLSPPRLRASLGLIRMCINDLRKEGVKAMSKGLDPECANPAYVYGRLMAVYEDLQGTLAWKLNQSKVNRTVTDRFFSLASTRPSAAFASMVPLGLSHLKKLRGLKDGAKAAYRIEKRITEITGLLNSPCAETSIAGGSGSKPLSANLTLEEQGLFAIGYYHEKAHICEKRRSGSGSSVDDELDSEPIDESETDEEE
jgi:CRISPR-associated protein Csd1